MPHNRYFIDSPFAENTQVRLSGDECHHLLRVSRIRINEPVELVNGQGQLAQATLTEIGKNTAELSIDSVFQDPRQKIPLILALGIPRMNHLEWIIEKGTELNVTAFWLFPGILSEKESLSPNQQERLTHLAISAMKQCGRLDLPSIELKPPLLQWGQLPGTLLFGDTDENASYLWKNTSLNPLTPPVTLCTGPEKGFDSQERMFLLHTLKAHGVRLHPNILRAETAPLVGLSLIQTMLPSN